MKNKVDDNLFFYSKLSNKETLKKFNTSLKGYNSKKANYLLEIHGKNILKDDEKLLKTKLFFNAFLNYFNLLLLIIIIISFFTEVLYASSKDYTTIVIVLSIVMVSGLIQYVEELKSLISLDKLKKSVINTTAVIRDGNEKEISTENIIEGDIIKLSAGDIIPADLKILSCKDLFVSESTFTGESIPVEKNITSNKTNTALDLNNICFMGTNVVSGSATGIVIGTGKKTYLANMTKDISNIKEETAFDRGIKNTSKTLLKITMVLTPLVFLINLFTKGSALSAIIFALTVAVGTTPEFLPMIISSNLAKGTKSLAKKKVIVKTVNSIQNLGAIDVLCTDKTGTITEDNIILDEYLDIRGNEDMSVLNYAYLNSYYQTGLKNLLDIAIINRTKEKKLDIKLNKYKKIDEIPFDFSRRRMSVVLEDNKNNTTLITKGAVEEILAISSHVHDKGKIIKINKDLEKEIKETSGKLNKKGLRVIAVANKTKNIPNINEFSDNDEKEMTLIGFVSFLDPPKKSAKKALMLLKEYGVNVKVITGDNELVAKSVCKQVGIDTKHSLVGVDIDKLNDQGLRKIVSKVTLFSKIDPIQKARIVSALQSNGHVVGYLGDGINDAPALKKADVGISVDSGVEIAKEVANIVLLEKNLLVLEEGIIEGRKVFANIMKYLNMTLSSDIGNMVSFIIASIFIPFMPILPIQILIQNLLYDISQMGISFDNVDKEYIDKPQKWNVENIKRFIYWLAPLSSIFDFLIFAILWYILGANSIMMQSLFQSGWFVMGVVSQTIIIYVIRTKKIPFYKSKPSKTLIYFTLFISIIGILLPFLPIAHIFGLVLLPVSYIFIVIFVMILYFISAEIIKKIYIKKYNEWY